MNGRRLAAAAGGLSGLGLGLLLLLYLVPQFVPEAPGAGGHAPGPRALPLVLAWGLVILGAIDTALVLAGREEVRWRRPERPAGVLLLAVIIVGALVLIPYFGMILVGTVMVATLMIVVSGQPLLPSMLIALLFGAALYVTFVLLVGVPLPGGSVWG